MNSETILFGFRLPTKASTRRWAGQAGHMVGRQHRRLVPRRPPTYIHPTNMLWIRFGYRESFWITRNIPHPRMERNNFCSDSESLLKNILYFSKILFPGQISFRIPPPFTVPWMQMVQKLGQFQNLFWTIHGISALILKTLQKHHNPGLGRDVAAGNSGWYLERKQNSVGIQNIPRIKSGAIPF